MEHGEFAAVRVEVVVRLPVEVPDGEWVPYAENLRAQIVAKIEEAMAESPGMAPGVTERWEVR